MGAGPLEGPRGAKTLALLVLTPAGHKGASEKKSGGSSQWDWWEGKPSVFPAPQPSLRGLPVCVCKVFPDPCLKEELPFPEAVAKAPRDQPLPRADAKWGSCQQRGSPLLRNVQGQVCRCHP